MPKRSTDIFRCKICQNESIASNYCNKCNRAGTMELSHQKEIDDDVRDIEALKRIFPGSSYYYYTKPRFPTDPPSYEDKYSVNGVTITKAELNALYRLGKIKGPHPTQDRQMRPI